MRKPFRIISRFLLLSLIVSASASVAYAGSGGSSSGEVVKPANAEYIDVEASKNTWNNASVSRVYDNYINDTDLYTYVLEVSTGANSGHVENINIKYAYEVNTNGYNYAMFTQTLTPSEGAAVTASEDLTDITDYTFVVKSEVGFQGSRFSTYAPLYSVNPSVDPTGPHYGTNHDIYKTLNAYSSWATSLTHVYQEGYDNASKILDGDATFSSYTTEYIRFKTEKPISSLLELDFIVTGTGTGDWSLNGWKLFRIQEWTSSSIKSLEPSSSHNEVRALRSSTDYQIVSNVELNTFSFLSDRLSLTLSNATLIAQSNDAELQTNGGGIGAIAYENGIGNICFVNTYYTNNRLMSNLYVEFDSYDYYYSNRYTKTRIQNIFSLMDTHSSTTQNGYKCGSQYTDTPTTLNFSVNIQDSYKAGIDSLFSVDGSDVLLRDVLTAKIKYKNTWGYTEEVTVPVISDAFIEYAVDATELNTDIDAKKSGLKAFAQQGDSLCFSVTFSNYSSLESIELTYDNQEDTSDYIVIEDVTVYDDHSDGVRGGYYNASSDAGVVSLSIPEGSTMLYRTLKKDRNMTFDSASTKYTYEFGTASEVAVPEDDYSNTYLVTIKTSDVQAADTEADVIVQFNFISTDGTETTTTEYNIGEACKEFYGYVPALVSANQPTGRSTADWWEEMSYLQFYANESSAYYSAVMNKYVAQLNPKTAAMKTYNDVSSTTLSTADVSYLYGMQRDGTIKFFIKATDLSKFTSVSFHIQNSTDLWQMDSLTIQSVESVGDRTFTAIEDNDIITGLKTYLVADREVTGNTLYTSSDIGLLINNSDTKEYNLSDSKISGGNTERDYQDYYYNMTYEMANSDLHFDEAAKKYEVRVNVGGNTKATEDDGCGSNNLFYFQLVFKNGVSSYVLANQQLYSDGFRTGQTETFYISTNEDYGDLVAVNIIPDDVSEDSSKMDKLNIDSIEVIKENSGSVDKKYVISSIPNDGWISMEYVDDSDSESSTGRYAGEIVQSFPVTSSSYMLQLEFAIVYYKYPSRYVYEENEFGVATKVEKDGIQFHGDMVADIEYINTNNETKHISDYQLVANLYSYDGMSATGTSSDGTKTISDTDWMFRGNTTDRFVVDIDDAISITSITLRGTPDDNVSLPIKEISVNILKSKSYQLSINNNNEYQRNYDSDSALLVNQVTRNLPETFYFPANQTTSYTFNFADNEIPEFETESSLESIVSRTPDSVNDTLNVYITMADGSVPPSISGLDLLTTIQYSSASTGKSYVSTIKDYKESTDKDGHIVLAATGISATNMSLLNSVSLKADSDYKGAYIDSAFIQQVRNGTIIDTYNIDFIGSDASSRTGVSMGTTTNSSSMGEGQTVTLQLGTGTSKSKLTSEKYDIAVSLLYYSRVGDTEKLYASPYVFLTDNSVYSIYPGMMATFDFEEYGVREIAGIRVIGMNGLKATVESAAVETYTIEADDTTETTGYYSIDLDAPTALATSSKDLAVTDSDLSGAETMVRADFTFKTMSSSDNVDSSGTAPIRMVIHYATNDNLAATKEISDIRSYVSDSGSFTQGSSATVSLFLKGAKYISYIELEPYDTDSGNVASWNLESLTFELSASGSGGARTININKTIRERTTETSMEQINLSSIVVELAVTASDNRSVTVRNNSATMNVYPGETISMTVSIHNTLPKYNYLYKVETASGDARSTYISESKKSDRIVTFQVPADAAADTQYVLTFSAEESTTVTSSLVLQVQKTETTTQTSDSGSENAGDSGEKVE